MKRGIFIANLKTNQHREKWMLVSSTSTLQPLQKTITQNMKKVIKSKMCKLSGCKKDIERKRGITAAKGCNWGGEFGTRSQLREVIWEEKDE